MKKYMKPIMESESFVANEYVAVCSLITCYGKCGETELVNGYTPNEVIANKGMIDMDGTGYYMYTGTVNNVPALSCENTSLSSIPPWIDNIYNSGDEWWKYGLENLVYAFYKLFGGKDNVNISHYHPVKVTEKGTSDGPNAS